MGRHQPARWGDSGKRSVKAHAAPAAPIAEPTPVEEPAPGEPVTDETVTNDAPADADAPAEDAPAAPTLQQSTTTGKTKKTDAARSD